MKIRDVKQKLPRTQKEWARAAEKSGVLNSTVHTQEYWHSGSEVTLKEYLLFRTIRPTIRKRDRAKRDLRLDVHYQKAAELLQKTAAFTEYLNGLGDADAHDDRDLGRFEETRDQQAGVCALEDSGHDQRGLHGPNEELVNSSLISLHTALCLKIRDIQARWTSHRASLKHDFQKAQKAFARTPQAKSQDKQKEPEAGAEETKARKVVGQLSCQLDGYLYSSYNAQTQLILEAKRYTRDSHEPSVSWQETYELNVGMLIDPPKGLRKDRAFLISQDSIELYVSSATYTNGWRSYMMGDEDQLESGDFATVQMYGPWYIDNAEHMANFAKIVLALALRASEEDREEDHEEDQPSQP